MRSLETLKLRMTAAAEGACKVAGFLNTHPKVASVWYLGFLPEGHPDRPVFEHQCRWGQISRSTRGEVCLGTSKPTLSASGHRRPPASMARFRGDSDLPLPKPFKGATLAFKMAGNPANVG